MSRNSDWMKLNCGDPVARKDDPRAHHGPRGPARGVGIIEDRITNCPGPIAGHARLDRLRRQMLA